MSNRDSDKRATISRIIDSSKGILIEEKGKIIEVNQQLLEILQLDNDKRLLGESIFKIFPMELRNELNTLVLSSDRHLDCIQTTVLTDHLELKQVFLEIKHLNDTDTIQRIFIFEDIARFSYKTREVEKYEENSTKEEDVYVDEAIKQFTRAMTHDINNKLTPIILSSEILTNQLEDKYHKHLAKTIHNSSHTISDKLLRLKAFSGEMILHRELFSLADIIPMIDDQFDVQIEWIVNEPLPLIHVDVTLINLLFAELIQNSIEASKGRDEPLISIRIGVTSGGHNRNYKLFVDEIESRGVGISQDRIVISIMDNGIGIDNEQLEFLGKPFFSTNFIGRGMGIAAISGIIKGHKGYFALDTSYQSGARFVIELPIPTEYK